MPIITISRGSYSRGKEVAEKLAQELGYECISREILLEASDKFHIPEIKLVRAIHDAPSILDRFTHGKDIYINYIRRTLLEHIQKDNVVYHGLAGHFLLQQIPHVLKVRIIADLDLRVKEEMKREKISAEEAQHILVKDDAERRKWALYLYGADPWDPRLYDIVIHIKNMTVDDAVENIKHTVLQPRFQRTRRGQEILDDLRMSAQVEAALIKDFPKIAVDAKKGEVFVRVRGSLIEKKAITAKINNLARGIENVKKINISIVPFIIED